MSRCKTNGSDEAIKRQTERVVRDATPSSPKELSLNYPGQTSRCCKRKAAVLKNSLQMIATVMSN